MGSKKSATFSGKPKPAPKAPKVKAEPKKRVRLSIDERTAKAQARYDAAVAKKQKQLVKLQETEAKRDVAAQALSAKIGGVQADLDELKAVGPKLPKVKDAVAAAFARSEKKTKKLEEQLKKERETMEKFRAEQLSKESKETY